MDISILSVAQHKGNARVWLQGNVLLRAGFEPSTPYQVRAERGSIVISKIKEPPIEAESAHPTEISDGIRIRKVACKRKNEKSIPIIDLNNAEMSEVLKGLERVRAVYKTNQIRLLPLASDIRIKERLDRAKFRVSNGEALKVGSLAHGGGILSHALHKGLNEVGIKTKLSFSNEIREDLTNHAMEANSIWDADTLSLNGPMQEFAFDSWVMDALGSDLDVLEAGLPCSGASLAGLARLKLEHPEAHPHVGHMVVPFLAIIGKTNPSVIVLENVKNYLKTASMCLIRNQLQDWGYVLYETIIRGEDWNALEHRERMVLVAVTQGMQFSFVGMSKPSRKERRLGEILEDVAIDSSTWSMMEGLKNKQERDLLAQKGFKMQIFDANSAYIATLTKGMAKNRSTDPKIRHPFDADLLRVPTVIEHVRAKGFPEELVAGLCYTTGHELAGQSVNYGPIVSIGEMVGYAYKDLQAATFAEPDTLLTQAVHEKAVRCQKRTFH